MALFLPTPGSVTATPITWQRIETTVPSGIRRTRADFGSGSARTATYVPAPLTVARSDFTTEVEGSPGFVVAVAFVDPLVFTFFLGVTDLRTTFFLTILLAGDVALGTVRSGGTVAAVGATA